MTEGTEMLLDDGPQNVPPAYQQQCYAPGVISTSPVALI